MARNCTLDHISVDFDQLSLLCEHSIKDTNLQQKSHLTDLALCYLDYLKFKLRTCDDALTAEQLASLVEISQ